MESKKDFLERFKLENLSKEEAITNHRLCNFRSCDYCQGRPKGTSTKWNNRPPIKKKTYNPKAPEKSCLYKECKYFKRILHKIDYERTQYYINYALNKRNKETEKVSRQTENITKNDIQMEDLTEVKSEEIGINLEKDDANTILQKLQKINIIRFPERKVDGDGSCLYRAVLVSLNEDVTKYMEIRNNLSNLILNSEIAQDFIESRNCKTK